MQRIPLSKCYVNQEIRDAALRAIESGYYILGKESAAFEDELAAYTGTKHAVLCSSWTMGVFLLHQAMGLKKGDEVLVPSHTAFPTIEPLIHCGAKPVFVDIDDTFCLDVCHLESAITPRTVGIIPVHIYGHPANLDRVFEVANKHHLWVIEDCAQAQGAQYHGKTVGSIAQVGAFSFYPSKNLTVLGDGGCICTSDAALVEKMRMLRNHGRKEKYLHEIPGFNVRFNEIQAAVGRVALKHLETLNEHRRQIAAQYHQRLQGVVIPPREMPWAKAVYHMYVIRAEKRDDLAQYLKARGIETGIHYPIPNHQQPAVTHLFPHQAPLPKTEQVVGEILSLPISGELSTADANRVCDGVSAFYGQV
ncbi:MAG: DegT/DnrJ/EryC1/StrS family aminotransferase [Candidatus Omnitrophica bacterium]|nr:DegT/DnrJ/EryC1/StrS family aminotransferase [Candidatus Omnitrophota bacterium]